MNDVPFPAGAEVEITIVLTESHQGSGETGNGAAPPVDALSVLEKLAGTVSAPPDFSQHRYSLRGMEVTYGDPAEPVAEGDWDVLR